MSTYNYKNKQTILTMITDMNKHLAAGDLHHQHLLPYMHEDIEVTSTDPINSQIGVENHIRHFWNVLHNSFPDLQIQPYILFGGEHRGEQCVCCAGNIIASFQNDFLGIAAQKQAVWLRFHAHFIMEHEKIKKAWYFIDLISLMRQSGYNVVPQRGAEIITSGPTTQDGIVMSECSEEESKKSFTLVNNMLDGLCSYDGKTLESMGQDRFWDVRNMMWYGPSGIGTTRGLQGFQKYHQIPFLTAFPNRGMLPREGDMYFSQIAEGNYMCDFGFPSMYAQHTGDGWLGLQATHKKVTMRVVDIWRREGDRLVENWVMIDIIDVLKQLGHDVFSMLEKQQKHS